MISWFWSATYHVKCPDGNKTVYRDIDKALPLALKDKKSSLDTQLDAQKKLTAKLKKEHEEKINGLLFTISEQNQSLMMGYRNVYLAFKSDPCNNSDILRRQTEEFTAGQQRLAEAKVQIAGLIQLAEKNPNGSDRILVLYEKVIEKLGISVPVEFTVAAIRDNRQNAANWIGGANNG